MTSKFTISIQGMENDLKTANNSFERTELGELEEASFMEALTTFESIEYPHDARFPPKMFVKTNTEKFTVTATDGSLFFNNPDDPNMANLKLPPADIIAMIQGKAPASLKQKDETDTPFILKQVKKRKNSPALVALCGLVMTASGMHVVNQMLYAGEPLRQEVEYEAFIEEESLASARKRFVGTYLTGQNEGDFALVLHASGDFEFYTFVNKAGTGRLTLELLDRAPYEFGRLRNKVIAVVSGMEAIHLDNGEIITFHKMLLKRYRGSYIDFLPSGEIQQAQADTQP